MSKPISEKIVKDLPAPAKGNKLHYFSGATLGGKKAPSGFAVRVTKADTKSFVLFYRKNGGQYLKTLGRWDENPKGGTLTVQRAIVKAKDEADAIFNRNADPRPERTRRKEDGSNPGGKTIADLLDEYVHRYVEKEAKLRGGKAIRRIFERLVKPAIGKLGIYDIRRSQVTKMVNKIADEDGLVMADRTLAYTSKAFNWYAANGEDDDFRSPIVKGMMKTKPEDRARDRVLSDEEIRDVWSVLDQIDRPECFAPYVRFVLRTGSRRSEALQMRWDEIEGTVWTIPASRYKNKTDHVVPLTDAAHKLIGKRRDGFVFSLSDGKHPFANNQRAKYVLDQKIAELRKTEGRGPMPPWTLHDLRRTARTLMSRAGVSEDHAERAIGHKIRGVRGIYDRHKFDAEKRAAFKALDALLDRILHPTENVADLAGRRRG